MPTRKLIKNGAGSPPPNSAPVAVIDMGSSSVRMDIGQIDETGAPVLLDSLQQEVCLGRDVFKSGYLTRSAIEDCIRTLNSFKRILVEYDVDQNKRLRVVATSAVREATNRDAFVDRVYIGSGFKVDVVDEADINRFTYLSLLPILDATPALTEGILAILEVGGGSTEFMLFKDGQLTFSHSYRLGSFRMRETLDAHGADGSHTMDAMQDEIRRTVQDMRHRVGKSANMRLIAMGGDIRHAVSRIAPEWDMEGVFKLPLKSLRSFTNRVASLGVDELVRDDHLTYPEAETLAPALLTYAQIADGLKLKHLLVSSISMRDGVMSEMAAGSRWAGKIQSQMANSAVELGKKFDFDEKHAMHVTMLALELFRGLSGEHQLPERYEQLLTVAGLLHDVGVFVSNQSHHKHSRYLIMNSNLFGVGSRDLDMVATIARYHRRALPKSSHDEYRLLDRDDRVVVSKLAAILRVADALDRTHTQRIRNLRIKAEDDHVLVAVSNIADFTVEEMALRQKGDMFENVFGKNIVLKKIRSTGKSS